MHNNIDKTTYKSSGLGMTAARKIGENHNCHINGI